jgi:predicted RNA-binding Zn-ribbon protein involved in translation (DUF1610 family)
VVERGFEATTFWAPPVMAKGVTRIPPVNSDNEPIRRIVCTCNREFLVNSDYLSFSCSTCGRAYLIGEETGRENYQPR